MKKDTRVSGETGQLQLFSGLIVCEACGQAMTVKTVKKNGKSYVYYICSTHKRLGTCQNNSISAKAVEKYVLISIRKQVTVLLSAEEQSGGIGLDELKSRKKAAIEGMIEKALLSIQNNNEYLVKSYAHMLDGVIKEAEYRQFRDDFRRQIEDSEKNIAQLQIEIDRLADDSKTRELVERFKEHGNITELDRRAVVGMVDSVIVRSSKDLEVVFRYESGLEAFTGCKSEQDAQHPVSFEYAEFEAIQKKAVV
jgi:hypothetical protein